MFGSNPAVVRDGPRKGLRNLADIEGPTDALLASLTDDQRKLAIAGAKAPEVTTSPNSARPETTAPKGSPSTRSTPPKGKRC
jgi:hypothetical protein